MPGKTDFDNLAKQGSYGFASKESKAWDEGWRYRYSDEPLNVPITDVPFPAGSPAEKAAWEAGWDAADNNSAGTRRMPATTGTAPVP